MERRNVELNRQEHEALAADDRRIAELLGTLTRVEAPGNFEFGVRARIAAGAESPQSPLLPFLKFAVPLTLVIVVGVFVAFYNSRSATDGPVIAGAPATTVSPVVPPIGDPVVPIPGQIVSPPDSEPVVPGPISSAPSTPSRQIQPVMVADGPGGKRTARSGHSIDQPLSGASTDNALTGANTKLPRGFESLENGGGNSNSNETQIPVSEVLGILGIVADYANGAWTVKSASEGSISAKSGIKAGDILDSIDGRRLEKDTSFKTPFTGKTIRVRRDGKQIDLNLGN
jgi:hypothetical protein